MRKSQVLLIPEPRFFYGQLDEDHFFGWLKEIAAVKDVSGTPKGLQLDIAEPIDRARFLELAGLLMRYGSDRRCLRQLVEAQDDPWFKEPDSFWYESVFGN
jgi:hypothetical protein